MQKLIVLFFAAFLLFSCKNNSSDQQAAKEDSLTAETVYTWEADLNDSTGDLQMKKVESDLDTLDGNILAGYLSDEHITLQFTRSSNDTAFIKIPDATYLTQQMGSTGAMERMATYVYNFTELPGIHYVNFDFQEGDHAQPGTYNRASFNNQ